MATTTQRIQLRRDSAPNWYNSNPTLQAGEVGFVTPGIATADENAGGGFKIGDGATAWRDLYAPPLTLSPGGATLAPLVFKSGTNLTTAVAGAIEFDGSFLYATGNTTSGRGHVPARQTFRLASNGSAIGPTIADFYGATSAINLVASAVYEIDFFAFLQRTGASSPSANAGTLTWTLTASSAPTLISASYSGSPLPGGIASGTVTSGYTGSRASTTAAFAATAAITDGAYLAYDIRTQVITNAATTFKLQITLAGGGTVTATPQAGSFYTVRRIAPTTGSFA